MVRAFSLVLSSILFVIGCGTAPEPAPKTARIGLGQLVNDYRDFPEIADRTYRNRSVQVVLEPNTYRIFPGRIEGWFGMAGTPGAVVFECDPPPDTKGTVFAVGICRGRVMDGIERANRIHWHIRITGVIVRPN